MFCFWKIKSVIVSKLRYCSVPSKIVHRNWRLLKQVFLFLITFLFAFLDKKKKLKFFFHLGGIFEGNYTPRGLHCFSSVMVRAPSLSLITYMLRYTGNFVENYYFLVNRLCYQFWRKTHLLSLAILIIWYGHFNPLKSANYTLCSRGYHHC